MDKPAKPTENSVLLPVTLPAGVEGRLGYTARRRYFVAYWEPAVGKPVLDDGQPSSGGVGQHWLYLDLVNQYWARAIERAARSAGVTRWALGGPETDATHVLLFDTQARRVWFVPREEAGRFLAESETTS